MPKLEVRKMKSVYKYTFGQLAESSQPSAHPLSLSAALAELGCGEANLNWTYGIDRQEVEKSRRTDADRTDGRLRPAGGRKIEAHRRGQKHQGTMAARTAVCSRHKYAIWACEKFINGDAFGSEATCAMVHMWPCGRVAVGPCGRVATWR